MRGMFVMQLLKYFFPVLSLILVTSFLSIDEVDAEETHSLVFSGVVLEQGNNPLLKQFSQWLAKQADYPLTTQFTDSYQGLSDILREKSTALAWTCGAPFVEDHAADQQQLIAIPLFHGAPVYRSFVMTRAGRTEKTLADFKGQVFAYSDPRSNSGFLAPSYALKQQGIDIHQHFRYLMHTGLHEYSLEALLAGQADVANIDEYVVDEYFKANPDMKDKLVILERLGPFPFTPIVAGKDVPESAVIRLQQALVSMHEDAQGATMLKQFGLDGFVVKPVSFYQPIVDMLNAVHQ
ncbi:MAG: PhnD/SsuA/transferrin family substrate-binding protein [Mariprofundus sp.]|nr:PhnD/SsuA/transferrin family substrate-binding protein [Mariprofundus sp.]